MSLDFRKFDEQVLRRIGYSAAELDFLRQLRYAGGRYSDFSKIVEKEPEIVKNLLDAGTKLLGERLKEPLKSVSVALSLMGFLPARNFLSASIIRSDEKDLIPGTPDIADSIPFAIKAESKAEEGSSYAQDLYVGGLFLDIVRDFLRIPDVDATKKAEELALKTAQAARVVAEKKAAEEAKVAAAKAGVEKAAADKAAAIKAAEEKKAASAPPKDQTPDQKSEQKPGEKPDQKLDQKDEKKVEPAAAEPKKTEETPKTEDEAAVSKPLLGDFTPQPVAVITKVPSEIDAYLSELFEHGLMVANVSRQLASKFVPAMNLEKDVCLDGMVHDVGKAIFCVLHGADYFAWLKGQGKSSRMRAWASEEKQFQVPHDVLGYHFLARFDFLRDSSWVVLFHHQPFMAKKLGKARYVRATLLWLSDYLCRHREATGNAPLTDRQFEKWWTVVEPALGTVSQSLFIETLKAVQF